MNTIGNSYVEKYAEDLGYSLAAKVDANIGIVVKPKPFWMPTFIYHAVIKHSVEIVTTSGIATAAYKPEV